MDSDSTESLDLDDIGPTAGIRNHQASGREALVSKRHHVDSQSSYATAEERNKPDEADLDSSSSGEFDAEFNRLRNQQELKRKRPTVPRKPQVKTGRQPSKPHASIVGRRKQSEQPTQKRVRKGWNIKEDGTHSEVSDDEREYALDDKNLPPYLQKRHEEFREIHAKLGDAGLKIPPDYGGIYFSDDEQEKLKELKERPAFPHPSKPTRNYEDIMMPRSAGVIPAPIAQWLRDYQIKGAEFMHELFVWQRGGILGDDMGLGKTIQVIAFLTAAFGKTGDERDAKRMRKVRRAAGKRERWYPRTMIICPGTLMANWRSELERWGWWTVYDFHESGAKKESALSAAKSGRLEIMITTYETYKGNMDWINTVDWDVVIADECHKIKERTSQVTQAMDKINALCRIGLTGTAIQNKYEELWTLLNWTNPGKFGALASWKESVSGPLKLGQAHDATVSQLRVARKTAEQLVNHLLPPYFLRRMKTLIAHQLPKKSDRVVFCPLTEIQADAYENFVDSDVATYIRTSTDKCDCGSGRNRGWCCYAAIPGRGKWQNLVFPCITYLKKLSNHLAMLIPRSEDPMERQDADLDALQTAVPDRWKDLYENKDSIMHHASQDFCGKWRVLKTLLKFWYSSGDKVLIFSHSVRLLKMLYRLFIATTHYNMSYLDGSMTLKDRARVVDEFNHDPRQFVFLISSGAGGVGLNITSANKVVVVDPSWNPALDLQAQDRAYRIGQTRDVEVFRLVSAGTIEEIVYARQIYKQQQAAIGYNASLERRYFRGVQNESDRKGEIFGLANLFSYQGDAVVLRDIVNKTNVAESRAGVQVIGVDNLNSQGDGDNGDGTNGDDDDPLNLSHSETGPNQAMDDDAATSQLAAWIAAGGESQSGETIDLNKAKGRRMRERPMPTTGPPKSDAVQAILTKAGVEYTHENSEVIGTSKIEEKLSRRALAQSSEVIGDRERYFTAAPGEDNNDDDDNEMDLDDLGTTNAASHSLGRTEPLAGWKYRPPEEVQQRQFCTMARMFDFEDPVEFALVIERMTQAERRDLLDRFYAARRKRVADLEG